MLLLHCCMFCFYVVAFAFELFCLHSCFSVLVHVVAFVNHLTPNGHRIYAMIVMKHQSYICINAHVYFHHTGEKDQFYKTLC